MANAFDALRRFWPEFERRDAQVAMAERVYETLRFGGRLAIEAPTGVGKSIAYLMPALLIARNMGARVLVSTQTKNLQQQILTKDAPRIRDTVAPGLSLTLLKGRANYLCLRRWGSRLQQELVPDAHASFLDAVGEWVAGTDTGDLEEFGAKSAEEWTWLRAMAAPDDMESGALCARSAQCFLRDVRRRAAQSNVVVVNHALLLTHHLTGAQVLPDTDILIVDEAHALADTACNILERRVSASRLRGTLLRLTGGPDLRLLEATRRLVMDRPELATSGHTSAAFARLVEAIGRTRRVGESFFRDVEARFGRDRRRYDRREAEAELFPLSIDGLLTALTESCEAARTILAALRSHEPRDEAEEETTIQFGSALTRLTEFVAALRFTIELPDGDYVHWYEFDREPSLVAVPLHPGDALRDRLFATQERFVLTSATLAAAGDFGHFVHTLGLSPDELDTAVAGEAFDHARQVLALAPPMPEPTSPAYPEAVASTVARLVASGPRKALVLCTSYQLLRDLRSRLASSVHEDVAVIAQGVDGQREAVTRAFRIAPRAVLIGTASFWEGVDFPGEELELLVMTRLPFPVPTDPLVAARCERWEAAGHSAFGRYMVPEAVLRFRQGFGRLIRRNTDRGVFVILDNRIRTARYRRAFTDALPVGIDPVDSIDTAVTRTEAWFAPARVEES